MVMVLPSDAALDALKQEVFEVESSDVIPEDGPAPPGSPPRASFMTQSKARLLRKGSAVTAENNMPYSAHGMCA